MWLREESEKFSLSWYVKLHLNFWENNTEALVISKMLNASSPRMTEQEQILQAA